MRHVNVSILLAFCAQSRAKEQSASHMGDMQDCTDKLVDKFAERALKLLPCQLADVDNAALRKPDHLAIHSASRPSSTCLIGVRLRSLHVVIPCHPSHCQPTLHLPSGSTLRHQHQPIPNVKAHAVSDERQKDGQFDDNYNLQILKEDEFEYDNAGQLVYSMIGHTPFPVGRTANGTRVQVDVGKVGQRKPRTFNFANRLGPHSSIFAVTLPRPLGVDFEETFKGRVEVVELKEKGSAWRLARVGQLSGKGSAIEKGDLLRAITTTNFNYSPQATFGFQKPDRVIVLYGCDDQSWSGVRRAMLSGQVADGKVTLVLERETKQDRV